MDGATPMLQKTHNELIVDEEDLLHLTLLVHLGLGCEHALGVA